MSDDVVIPDEFDDDSQYEMSAEEATNLDGKSSGAPGILKRKKILIAICCVIAATVMIGVISNNVKSSKKAKAAGTDEYAQNRSNTLFLSQLRDSGLRNASYNSSDNNEIQQITVIDENEMPQPLLPPVMFEKQSDPVFMPPANTPKPAQTPTPQPSGGSGSGSTSSAGGGSHFNSPLVPKMQGSLFMGSANNSQPAVPYASNSAATPYDDYLSYLNNSAANSASHSYPSQNQTEQNGNQDFYNSTNNSPSVFTGQYLGDNSLWTGTIVPAILETSINTDLPGQVLARVTQNIYDSQTGRSLLIPQGTILIARYNSSVSYAQSRVQIIWDTLIRPDGFQLELEGANGVDRAGMSGQEAKYNGNFFEYVKAAGIITLFSVANAKMTDTVQKYSDGSDTTASAVAESNAQFFNQLGGQLTQQASGVQPTLTVDNGAIINIMLNKTLYLPPMESVPPAQRYILE